MRFLRSAKHKLHMDIEHGIEWWHSTDLVSYEDALSIMHNRVDQIINIPETLGLCWFLEHPSLYTKGTSAKDSDLLTPHRFPVYETGRGGQFTYHGPGQRVIYIMLDLKKYRQDVRWFVGMLEECITQTLAALGVESFRREGRVGIWVHHNNQEKKIAALGIRVKKWVTFHGIAINITPDLEHFSGIVPCGLPMFGVTSLAEMGGYVSPFLTILDHSFKKNFIKALET